jgi:hypothetical protein
MVVVVSIMGIILGLGGTAGFWIVAGFGGKGGGLFVVGGGFIAPGNEGDGWTAIFSSWSMLDLNNVMESS